MPTFGQSVTYRDDKGQTARMRFYVVNATAGGALTSAENIITQLNQLTNAAFDGATGAWTSPPDTHDYGANANYEHAEDKCVMVYQTATGSLHRYSLPAPKEAFFEADGETMKAPNAAGDPQQVILASLNSSILLNMASRDGVLIESFIGGSLRRSKTIRRFNIFTRNPALTGPGL